jgi:hypothetical protein
MLTHINQVSTNDGGDEEWVVFGVKKENVKGKSMFYQNEI